MMPECVEIPAGTFLFGGRTDDKFADATEFPARPVEVSRPFLMSVHPVTVGLWKEWAPFPGDSDLPVTGISWHEAVEFCEWLAEETAHPWRLPHEDEWEYACRAGTTTPFSTGHAIGVSDANYLYAEDGRRVGVERALPVGSFKPNPFGLHEMHGNVLEWTGDPWRSSHDTTAPVEPDLRVVRGGGWDYLPRLLRSSWRDGLPADSRQDNLGFRIVCDLPQRDKQR